MQMASIYLGTLGMVAGSALTYFFFKKNETDRVERMDLEAKARAKAIEYETERNLQEAKLRIKDDEVALQKAFQDKELAFEKEKNYLAIEKSNLNKEKELLSQKEMELEDKERYLDALKVEQEKSLTSTISVLEQASHMDRNEAKKHLLEQYEKSLIADKARLVRKYDKLSQDEIDKRANYVLSQAVTRYAGDFANEKLINHISIPTDEHKGRIIGKEGRNIKTLEQILGVDIVIDDTPGVIVVSGFNLYRRAIATQTLKLLIDGGIINPVKIEETYDKVRQDFEQKILEDGKNIVLDLGLYPMHDEIMRLIGRLRYRASYGQNALAHSLEVAKLASVMAVEMGGDEKLALRAGLLHDIGKALTQDFGGSHVTLGADICKRHKEHPIVINAIYAHHRFEGIEPDGVESASVCAADALSAARPGARREVLESFTKRVKEIEAIALSRVQVKDAYAMSSGRELRVIVDAHKISDDEMTLLLKGITKEIEENVEFPGEIKISLIREKREISYAR